MIGGAGGVDRQEVVVRGFGWVVNLPTPAEVLSSRTERLAGRRAGA